MKKQDINAMMIQENLALKLLEFFTPEDIFSSLDTNDENREEYTHSVERALKDAFKVSWSLGGSWGNCYDNELTHSSAQAEPSMSQLDNFLSKFYPSTSFMQYKRLEQGIVMDTERLDYYGGDAAQATKYLPLESLQNTLVECGLETYSTPVDIREMIKANALEKFPKTDEVNKDNEDWFGFQAKYPEFSAATTAKAVSPVAAKMSRKKK